MNYKQTFNKTALAAAMLSILQSGASAAAVQYNVTDLGTLGGTYSLGLGINEIDEVTGLTHGFDNTVNQAFLYGAAGIAQSLGPVLGGSYNQSMDINNFHQVTGQASLPGDAAYHAFVWQNAQPYDLGTLDLLTGTGTSLGVGINDNQQVAGYSTVKGGTAVHAVVWSKGSTKWTINDIGTLDRVAGTGNSQANGINETGQVTGFSTVPGSTARHAVVWRKGSTNWSVLDIGTLGGSYGAGFAINGNGEVTGTSTTTQDAEQHAFVAQSTQIPPVMIDLLTLGGKFSEGYSINLAGEVVGYSTTTGDQKQAAFLWQSGTGMQDLNTLIDPLSGWALLEAHAINDKGNIAGIGLRNGEKHAFLLTKLVTDKTPPLVNFQIAPAVPSATGWYLTAPSVAWTVTDPESTVSAKVGCAAVPAVTNTAAAGQTFSCTATSAGGTTGPVTTPAIKVDTTLPTFVGVPAPFTQAATSLTGTVANYTKPTAVDNVSGVSLAGVSCVPASGSVFPMGASTVNCSVKDNAGNGNSASFVVTVADLTPPIFPVCPATVNLAQGQALLQPVATDNLSTPLVTGAPASLPAGTSTVTWTATDAAGLSSNCIQQVTVVIPTPTPTPTVSETIAISKAQCKRINATSGEWLVQGSSSNSTNNSIQLYSSASVPVDLTSNKLGAAVTVAKGAWQFQAKSGPACISPISLRSTASGKVLGNIAVTVQ